MGTRSLWDYLRATPAFKTSRTIFDQMDEVCKRGVDADEMPDGQGKFGYAPSNPIPTRTMFGSISYLARLCDRAGNKVQYKRIGSISPDNIDYPVDVYAITAMGLQFELYFSPYQKRNSAKSPEGLRLAEPPPQPPPYKTKKKGQLYGWLSWAIACLTLLTIWWTLIFGYYWIINPQASRRYGFQDHLLKIAVGMPALITFVAIVIRVGGAAVKRIDSR